MAACKDLLSEREKATFSVRSLTYVWDGGRSVTDRRESLRTIVEGNPAFRKTDEPYLTHEEQYARGLEKCRARFDLAKKLNIETSEDTHHIHEFIDSSLPLDLHDGVFVPTILGQCNEEQQAKWLEPALQYGIIGCYAQTELGHGSNVRGLETTATYVRETDEIELHTPSLRAVKWWPGCLGATATHAVVYAQLRVPQPDGSTAAYGVQPFMAPIRCARSHRVLPGCEAGDIGPKMGYNGVDNGFLRFTHYRIPRTNMLMKHAQLGADGSFSKPRHAKIAYATMVKVRSTIVEGAASQLARAVTVAVRYAAVRRQFASARGAEENQVLDYTGFQYRILPLIATAFALRFTGRYISTLYDEFLVAAGTGDLSSLGVLHSTSSGLKSLVSRLAKEGIDASRMACGGHGYSTWSGLGRVYRDYLAVCVAEGDNFLLPQQTTRHLLKDLQRATMAAADAGDDASPAAAAAAAAAALPLQTRYLSGFASAAGARCAAGCGADFRDPALQLSLFAHRALSQVAGVGAAVQQLLGNGTGMMDTFNAVQWEVIRASDAHCLYVILLAFNTVIDKLAAAAATATAQAGADAGDAELAVLRRLRDLFALHQMEAGLGDLLETGYLSGAQAGMIRAEVRLLLKETRTEAVAMVDSFNFSDHMLNSALGRYDGRVYEALYARAQGEPMNKEARAGEPNSAFMKYMQPLITGDGDPAGIHPDLRSRL